MKAAAATACQRLAYMYSKSMYKRSDLQAEQELLEAALSLNAEHAPALVHLSRLLYDQVASAKCRDFAKLFALASSASEKEDTERLEALRAQQSDNTCMYCKYQS